jgi:glycosyltransferase involved in cell wall biosynthesis
VSTGSLARLAGRVLLCSMQLPPRPNGGAAVVERMFRGIDPRDYRVISFHHEWATMDTTAAGLPAKTMLLDTAWRTNPQPGYRLAQVRYARKMVVETIRRGRVIAEMARDEGCAAIVVTSSISPDPAAALLAARLTGIPYFPYMWDNWRHLIAISGRLPAALAAGMQSAVLAGARTTFVVNSSIAEDLLRDHGRHSLVVGIPLPDPRLLDEPPVKAWPSSPGRIGLLFTGQVYAANLEALTNVVAALNDPRLDAAELHIYAAQSEAHIKSRGLDGKVVVHPHVQWEELRQVQREADILILALSFTSPYPDIIRTASPTKTGEYLASGRPVLVHAPPDSYPAAIARRFGLPLVDRRDPRSVADAIARIAEDPSYRDRIIAGARRAALALYSPKATTERFVRAINHGINQRT